MDKRDPLSRRDFMLRASQLGALTVLGPRLDFLPPFAGATHAGVAAIPTTDIAAPNARTRAAIADLYSGLRWRMLGPFRGGRAASASGVHGRPNEFYFGAVNGGVWKTIDAGRVWKPV